MYYYVDLPLTTTLCGIVAVLLNGSPVRSTTKTDTICWPPLILERTPLLCSMFPFLLRMWKEISEVFETATRTPTAGESGIKLPFIVMAPADREAMIISCMSCVPGKLICVSTRH